ncbi:hypothetical protein SAMN05446635_6796 [Burkholderia sp. OK233]|nr:hypothetical protein SAMN05446635_6796 [Burkholderia sp. OK233]
MPVCRCGLSSIDGGGRSVIMVAAEVDGSIAMLNSGDAPKLESDDTVRIGVDVVFNLDVLKPSLPTEPASGEVHRANTKEQMSLDLEDL